MADMWTPPAGATPQQDPSGRRLDDGMGVLAERLDSIAAQLRDIPGHLLEQAGIYVTPQGLTVTSALQSADFDGDLAAGNPGTTGWAMNAARVAIGELLLRPGSLGNDTLAHPIGRTSGVASADGFGLGTTWTVFAEVPIVVPDGFTEVIVTVLGSADIYNTSGSTQYVYLRALMNRSDEPGVTPWAWGGTQRVTLANGFAGSLLAPLIRGTSEIPPGTTLTFYVQASASAAIPASPVNWAGTEVQVIFSR